jgi:hypothetical protein
MYLFPVQSLITAVETIPVRTVLVEILLLEDTDVFVKQVTEA